MNENNLKEKKERQTKKTDNDTSCCKEPTKCCDDSSCCQETEMKRALRNISWYTKSNKNKLNFFTRAVALTVAGAIALLLIIGGFLYLCSNCCQNKDEIEGIKTESVISKNNKEAFQDYEESNQSTPESIESKKSVQRIDSVKLDFNTKAKAPSFNLSMKAKQNSNSRSDCFWFIIVFTIVLCLILLFYLISYSSRESKLLQFVIEWNEQEKEIKLKEIEKCKEIELRKIDKEIKN